MSSLVFMCPDDALPQVLHAFQKLVPKLIEEILTRRDMPRSLGQLKRWVESGGTWRKKGYEKKAEKARRDKNKGDE